VCQLPGDNGSRRERPARAGECYTGIPDTGNTKGATRHTAHWNGLRRNMHHPSLAAATSGKLPCPHWADFQCGVKKNLQGEVVNRICTSPHKVTIWFDVQVPEKSASAGSTSNLVANKCSQWSPSVETLFQILFRQAFHLVPSLYLLKT